MTRDLCVLAAQCELDRKYDVYVPTLTATFFTAMVTDG